MKEAGIYISPLEGLMIGNPVVDSDQAVAGRTARCVGIGRRIDRELG